MGTFVLHWFLHVSKRAEDTYARCWPKRISRVLQMTNGRIAGKGGAAEVVGLNASTLRSHMKKLGLKSKWRP
jgi:transcriptional regulator with GAF, ATPase, and Fis domain